MQTHLPTKFTRIYGFFSSIIKYATTKMCVSAPPRFPRNRHNRCLFMPYDLEWRQTNKAKLNTLYHSLPPSSSYHSPPPLSLFDFYSISRSRIHTIAIDRNMCIRSRWSYNVIHMLYMFSGCWLFSHSSRKYFKIVLILQMDFNRFSGQSTLFKSNLCRYENRLNFFLNLGKWNRFSHFVPISATKNQHIIMGEGTVQCILNLILFLWTLFDLFDDICFVHLLRAFLFHLFDCINTVVFIYCERTCFLHSKNRNKQTGSLHILCSMLLLLVLISRPYFQFFSVIFRLNCIFGYFVHVVNTL